MAEERKIRLPGRVAYVAVVLFFALLVAGYFVYQIQQVVLAFAVTLLLAVVVSGPVNFLARRGLGRGWGTMVAIGTLILAFSLLGIAVAPTAEEQAEQFTGDLPFLLEEAEALVASTQDALGLENEARLELDSLPEMGRDFVSSEMLATTADIGESVLTVLSLVLVALIATIYLTIRSTRLSTASSRSFRRAGEGRSGRCSERCIAPFRGGCWGNWWRWLLSGSPRP